MVECGEGVSAAFGAKLMALLGASVIKVEPADGDVTRRRGPFVNNIPDPENSGLFLYLNADKQGVTLDLNHPSDRQTLDHLLAGADILIHNVPASKRAACAMEGKRLSGRHPRLIVAGISRYGDFGPRSHYKAYELNTIHASGTAILNPSLCESPDLAPLKYFGAQAEFQAGIHAAMAALGAFYYRATSGMGQVIELSEQECMATMLDLSLVWWTYRNMQTSRLGFAVLGPAGTHRCADGIVQLLCVEEAQWQRLVALMGNPEWTKQEIFKDRTLRGKNIDAITPLVEEWTKPQKKIDLVARMQGQRIPATLVSRPSDLYADEHLKTREFFVPLPARAAQSPILAPGVPFKSTAMGWTMCHPAPRVGEHNGAVLRNTSLQSATDKPVLDGPSIIPQARLWGRFTACACSISAGSGPARFAPSNSPDWAPR